jgi:hypothetical protein
MQLNFLGLQCQNPESMFAFLINFMLSHPDAFSYACSLCPFGHCYKYFIGSYAAFQIVSFAFNIVQFSFFWLSLPLLLQFYSTKEMLKLFQEANSAENREVIWSIPYLNIHVTQHKFSLMRHTLNLSSNVDLMWRMFRTKVRILMCNILNLIKSLSSVGS